MSTSGGIPRAEIEIDQLVLPGMSSADAERVAAAVAREISTLAAASGAGPGGSLTLEAKTCEIPSGLSAGEMGRRIAESIWNSRGSSSFAPADSQARPPARETESNWEDLDATNE